jgi:hypothetical protein
MAATTQERWRIGSTATSLLVAYLLVLQGVAVAFAGLGAGQRPAQGGFSASVLCASQDVAVSPDSKTAPMRSQRHGGKCCVIHCSSAGAPPPAAEALSLWRSWRAQASFFAWTAHPRAPRLLLPVGSRAPPEAIV